MSDRSESKRQDSFFDTCSKCKTDYGCCHETTPPVTPQRRKVIEAYLKKEKITVKKPFVEEDYVYPRLDKDGYCVFHDRKTKRCSIHSVKPETCVAGPITFDINRKTDKIEWFIKMEKICGLAGVVYGNPELMWNHLDSAKREISRLVRELDGKALEAILRKDEPETFKMDENTLGKNVLDKLRCN